MMRRMIRNQHPQPGDIWNVLHIPTNNPNAMKVRPFLVLSRKLAFDTYLAAPFTSTDRSNGEIPEIIPVKVNTKGWPQTGLSSTCYLQLHQVMPYSREFFKEHIGKYPDMPRVKDILRELLNL